ncbi:MAG TPA: cyclase family protein [Trichormus sp.]|jgi:arylformamidase
MVKQMHPALSQQQKILDISLPISSKSACFPGDTPFSRNITLTYRESKVVNLTAMTMSPHVGTHTDSPVHVCGDMSQATDMAGQLPLQPFVGPALVLDLAPFTGAIKVSDVETKLIDATDFPQRILFRTCHQIRFDHFEDAYPSFSVELIDYLAERGILLVGIDAPSVDDINSKTLDVHHRLVKHKMCWLENLDLTGARHGNYFLVALPLKLMELEASPVRAVLLEPGDDND